MVDSKNIDYPVKLTLNDRCDKCGSQAKHMYYIKHIGVLLFCNHCHNVNSNSLAKYNKVITVAEGWNE